jgi:hypothetical protein
MMTSSLWLILGVVALVGLNRYAPTVVVLILTFVTGLLRGLLGR